MKKSITPSRALKLAVLMLLMLWAGYAVGYHRGIDEDQRVWWASVTIENGHRVFLGPPAVAGYDLTPPIQRNAPAAVLNK